MTTTKPGKIVALGLWAGVALGCRQAPLAATYEVAVRVESDAGQALGAATLYRGANVFGVSGADGRVVVRTRGSEGQRLELTLLCPEGFRSPTEPFAVTLRKATGGKQAEYVASCKPLRRKLVVAVRLDNGKNIPIRYLGRELARTDASGAAHLLVEDVAEQLVELTLDTSEQPNLRPKSPTARFRFADEDELLVLNQRFELPVARKFAPARPTGPIRIR